MTLNQEHQSQNSSILERFKQGVFMDEEAYLYREHQVGIEGIKLIKQSLKELDALGPNGRNPLIPLLDDPAPAIRIWAAAALVKIMPERALDVLHEIRDRSMYDARMTASHLLILYEQGRLNY